MPLIIIYILAIIALSKANVIDWPHWGWTKRSILIGGSIIYITGCLLFEKSRQWPKR